MTRLQRVVLVCVSLVLGLAVAEGGLRAVYPTLPSKAGLAGQVGWQEGDAIQRCDARGLVRVEPPPPTPSGRRLLVTGDSLAVGFGVPTERRFGALLARKLGMSEVNSALAGGTACVTLDLTLAALARAHADLAVVALFADDLMEAPRFSVNGRPVAFPDTVRTPWLRALVSRSYAANTVWWGIESVFFDRPRSLARDPSTVAALLAALAELREAAAHAGTPVVLTLLPPAGLPSCGTAKGEEGVCALAPEMDRIAELLDRGWPGWVDLRRVFDGGDYVLDVEAADARLDLHPDEAGHARIAEALYPAVRAAGG